jgi:Asp/Glu/hydantoin racemase
MSVGILLLDARFPRPLDVEAAARQVVAAAKALAEAHSDIAALVLECRNLPPYAARIQEATGLPVWDAISLVRWGNGAVRQRAW